jgi:glucan phosphoethanolaminetransferase (alkaline phosphatase superfamily)
MKQHLSFFAAALWWGSLTTLGFLVVPQLFKHLATPALAGGMAAQLFAVQTWVSVGCGVVLLFTFHQASNSVITPGKYAKLAIIFTLISLLLALCSAFVISPRIIARENLKLWHGLGSVAYLLQWLGGGAVLWTLVSSTQEKGA